MKKTKIFLLNGLLLTCTSLILKSIGMFFGVYISNKIGTEAVGVYGLIMSVYMFFITFASSGINLATSRIVSEQKAFGNEKDIPTAVKKCILYSLIMGSIAGFVLFILSPYISENWLHAKVSSIPFKIIAISLPCVSISSSINGYFTAVRRVKKTAFSQVFEQVLKIGFITFLFNYFLPSSIENASISLVLGGTISEIASCLLVYFFYKKDIKKAVLNRGMGYTKQILRITIPIAFAPYIRSGLSTLKQILIPLRLEKSGISCEKALSQYGIINGMTMPLIMFPCTFIYSFSSLLIPEFSYLNAKHDKIKINFAINRILKFCFIFSFLIMGIFWCFSDELASSIYNETSVAIFIKVLSPLIVLMYVDNIVDSILKGLDKQVACMGINILDLITSISFIYFLLPIKGINGYIIVLFISEFLNGILSLILLIKETHIKIDFSNWLIKPIFSIIFLHLLVKNLNCNNITDLIIQIIIFTLGYFLCIVLLKGLVKDDLKI